MKPIKKGSSVLGLDISSDFIKIDIAVSFLQSGHEAKIPKIANFKPQ